jgi:cytochrome b561
MRSPTTAEIGYTPVAKILHWFIVALLIGQFAVAWTMPHIGRNTKPETLINLHFSLGMLILFLVVLRLAWRMTHHEPPPIDGLPPWQGASARALHWLLYALLFAIPVLGWLNASWRGFDVTFFGLFKVPALIATRAPGWNWTGDVHTFIANYGLLTVVGLHVVAALYHAVIRRDGVFERMLPAGWRVTAQ